MPASSRARLAGAVPKSCVWGGSWLRGDGGPVWQQAPIRQLESASARVAICPLRLAAGRLLLPAQGPSASCGAWPGGQAESEPAFCGVPDLSLWCPAVTTGVKSLTCSGPVAILWALVAGRVEVCAARCLSLSAGPTVDCPHPACPSPAVFHFFLGFVGRSAARAGRLFVIWFICSPPSPS